MPSRPYSGLVALFFATHPQLPEYHAFDPGFRQDFFNKSIKQLGRDARKGDPFLRDIGLEPSNLKTLAERIKAFSFGSYEEAVRFVKGLSDQNKTPIIFSRNVLVPGILNKKYAFWDLNGLHVHYFQKKDWNKFKFSGTLDEVRKELDSYIGKKDAELTFDSEEGVYSLWESP